MVDDYHYFVTIVVDVIKSFFPNFDYEYLNTIVSLTEEIERIKPDVLLLDLNFPEGNSLDLITDIRETIKDIAIIIMSAQTDIRTAFETITKGADSYLCKDKFFSSDLIVSFQSIIKKIQLNRENKAFKKAIFNPENFPMVLFQLSNIGVESSFQDFDIFPEPFEYSTEEFVLNLGISFVMLLGRGDEYHEGCFTFPIGTSKFYDAFLFVFTLPNAEAKDIRLRTGYYQLCLFVQKSFCSFFPSTDQLTPFIDVIKSHFDDARDLSTDKLEDIKLFILDEIKNMDINIT